MFDLLIGIGIGAGATFAGMFVFVVWTASKSYLLGYRDAKEEPLEDEIKNEAFKIDLQPLHVRKECVWVLRKTQNA